MHVTALGQVPSGCPFSSSFCTGTGVYKSKGEMKRCSELFGCILPLVFLQCPNHCCSSALMHSSVWFCGFTSFTNTCRQPCNTFTLLFILLFFIFNKIMCAKTSFFSLLCYGRELIPCAQLFKSLV